MTATMDLSIHNLVSPRRRSVHAARLTLDNESPICANNPFSLLCSTPTSPISSGFSRMIENDEMFTIFDQHRAAIPFKWEETPGIPLSGAEGETGKAEICSGSEVIDSHSNSAMSRSISSLSSSDDSSSDKIHDNHPSPFQFPNIHSHDSMPSVGIAEEIIPDLKKTRQKHAHQQFFNGHILPLKPPPGLHSIKQLMSLETDEHSSLNFSSRSLSNIISSSPAPHRRSFRRNGLKALPFLGSPKKEQNHSEEFFPTMLGFEEWPKSTQLHDKEHDTNEDDGELSTVMSRLSTSFRKKPATRKDNNFVDGDVFDEDFGMKSGLRENKTLTSVRTRRLGDGYNKSRSWVLENLDSSDSDTDTRCECFRCDVSVVDGDEHDDLQQTITRDNAINNKSNIESNSQSNEKHAMSRFSRFFRHSRGAKNQKPPRSSTVPIALTPLPSTRCVKGLKRTPQRQHQGCTTNPILKMCFSNPIGQALLKVKRFRYFEFKGPRSITVK